MQRTRNVIGLIAALMIIVSSGAHTILGWRGMRGSWPPHACQAI